MASLSGDQGPNAPHEKKAAKSGLLNLVVTESLEAFAFDPLAFQLAGTADSLGLFTGAAFRRLFIRPAHFHFPENTFALHFLFQRAKRLIYVVISNTNFHGSMVSCGRYQIRLY